MTWSWPIPTEQQHSHRSAWGPQSHPEEKQKPNTKWHWYRTYLKKSSSGDPLGDIGLRPLHKRLEMSEAWFMAGHKPQKQQSRLLLSWFTSCLQHNLHRQLWNLTNILPIIRFYTFERIYTQVPVCEHFLQWHWEININASINANTVDSFSQKGAEAACKRILK